MSSLPETEKAECIHHASPRPSIYIWVIILVVSPLMYFLFSDKKAINNEESVETSILNSPIRESQSESLYSTSIRKPTGPPTVKSDLLDSQGRPITISCITCHANKPANHEAKVGIPLLLFHQGQKGQHGNLSCTACHNAGEGYQTLKLADGKSLPYTEVMQLCAQCHGPQYRDYINGAHGGMTGHWDLRKGGRQRNNCIDCHDPHLPKYPKVQPAPAPNDRFLHPSLPQGAGHE